MLTSLCGRGRRTEPRTRQRAAAGTHWGQRDSPPKREEEGFLPVFVPLASVISLIISWSFKPFVVSPRESPERY